MRSGPEKKHDGVIIFFAVDDPQVKTGRDRTSAIQFSEKIMIVQQRVKRVFLKKDQGTSNAHSVFLLKSPEIFQEAFCVVELHTDC